jgi:hypothetical protein
MSGSKWLRLISDNEGEARQAARDLVKMFIQDYERLSAVWHPLGFINLKMMDHGCVLRCHIWQPRWPQNVKIYPVIHNHTWHVQSRLLMGSVKNELFDVSSGTASPTHQIYRIEYDGALDRIISTGRHVRADLRSVDIINVGERYGVPIGEFHRTSVIDGRAASILVTEFTAPAGSPEMLGEIGGTGYSMQKKVCEPEFVAQRLTEILHFVG